MRIDVLKNNRDLHRESHISNMRNNYNNNQNNNQNNNNINRAVNNSSPINSVSINQNYRNTKKHSYTNTYNINNYKNTYIINNMNIFLFTL